MEKKWLLYTLRVQLNKNHGRMKKICFKGTGHTKSTLNLTPGQLLLNTVMDESARQPYRFQTNFPTELLGHPRDVPRYFRMHLL